MRKIAVFASGSGTNAENLYNFFSRGTRITVDCIIYDRATAGVVERMAPYGVDLIHIPARVWREEPQKIVELLKKRDIELVALAGFLRIVPKEITDAFPDRILNIHPSLLPAYGGTGMFGANVHQAVIENAEIKSGVTVHYVSEIVDGGEILMQEEVEIEPGETAESLEAKIHQVEYSLFPRAVVAALAKLPPVPEQSEVASTVANQPTLPPAPETMTPPPSPDQEWADCLGVNYDPTLLPPPYNPEPSPIQPPVATAPTRPVAYNSRGPEEMPLQPIEPHPLSENPLPPAGQKEVPPMPPTYLVLSVLATILCCFIPGIVAIVLSSRVSSKYYDGDYDGAKRASDAVQWWIIASFILGLLTQTLYLPLMMLF